MEVENSGVKRSETKTFTDGCMFAISCDWDGKTRRPALHSLALNWRFSLLSSQFTSQRARWTCTRTLAILPKTTVETDKRRARHGKNVFDINDSSTWAMFISQSCVHELEFHEQETSSGTSSKQPYWKRSCQVEHHTSYKFTVFYWMRLLNVFVFVCCMRVMPTHRMDEGWSEAAQIRDHEM